MTTRSYPPGIAVDESACDPQDLSPCGGVAVTVAGDVAWEVLVDLAVTHGWPGVEALAGIGGTVAEVVRGNSARHGQSVSRVVAAVRTWDRHADAQRTVPWSDCAFTPGGSLFQERLPDGRERYDVREVSLLFKQGELTAPVTDPTLTALLGVPTGARVPLDAVRDAVAGLPSV